MQNGLDFLYRTGGEKPICLTPAKSNHCSFYTGQSFCSCPSTSPLMLANTMEKVELTGLMNEIHEAIVSGQGKKSLSQPHIFLLLTQIRVDRGAPQVANLWGRDIPSLWVTKSENSKCFCSWSYSKLLSVLHTPGTLNDKVTQPEKI